MKKILITGANGLLGRELVELLSTGYEVHAFVRSDTNLKLSNIFYHSVDLANDDIESHFPLDIHTVVHLAQSEYFRDFPEKATNIFSINVSSTAHLLDISYKRGVKKFILASSGGVYGNGGSAFNENESINSNMQLGYYLGSKLCAEILAQNYTSFMDVLIMRFFFMYGKHQKRSMLIPRLVDSVKFGKPIQLQGENGIKINPIHVSDAAKAVKAALDLKGSDTFNIAGDEILSIGDITQVIAGKINKTPNIERLNSNPKHLIGDISLMKEKLHKPEICFSDGVWELL